MDTKKHHCVAPSQQASQYALPEKLTEIHWLRHDNVPSLNAMKILTVRLVQNFKNLNPPVFDLLAGLLDCQTACRKTSSTRGMASEFSHNRGNRI